MVLLPRFCWKYARAAARAPALAGTGVGASTSGAIRAGEAVWAGTGCLGRCRSREVRNAPGRSMRSGQDHPYARMWALSAVAMSLADHASRSRPDRVSASQIWPGCTCENPMQREMTPAASFWMARGRGALRRARRGGRFFVGVDICVRAGALGELVPTGLIRLPLRGGGRSQTGDLSTGTLRLTKCHIEGRRKTAGACAAPVPRRISIANPASARSRRTVVTVRGEQPAARAAAALVIAQCRPLP
ncbi:hypothetical protein DSM43518_03301 [Mycobacterium marinum]|nr:hypothetical protein DSM43518_03301 [Mycobacterium marinum]